MLQKRVPEGSGVRCHDIRESEHLLQGFGRSPVIERLPEIVAIVEDQTAPALEVADRREDFAGDPLLHDQGFGVRPVPDP